MRDVDIVYLYEHAARELDVACAVTARLRRDHGLRVEIVHWPHGFAEALGKIRPRLVILPFCYSERSYINLLHFWYKARFFNITWEQLFYPGNRIAKTPHGEFALRHVVHHTWSETYADFLKSQGISAEYIFSNGQPAYALYEEPYRRYFISREDLAKRYGLDPRRRWIFFPENYNWAFYSQETIQRFIADGQSPEDIAEMREFCERSLAEVVNWCRLAASDGNIELILRPRPATGLENFRAAVEHLAPDLPASLHILEAESVREWILASDVVVSSHSTSLIEAAVAGKRIYMLEPYPIPAALRMEWHDCVPRIRTSQQFVSICQDAASADDHQLENWARSRLMSKGDPIRNLSDYLEKLVNGKAACPPYFLNRDFLTPAKRVLPVKVWAVYRHVTERARPVALLYQKDFLSSAEIEKRISLWETILA